ncbi:MAG: 7-carboxy-7-deazaguanine synthase [Bilophila wadsworthia]
MEQENMAYRVKEIFYTLQGEGAQAGRPAVFCRFSGCNLWSGRPEDRATAKCRFCDTDFVGADAGVFATAEELAQTIAATFLCSIPSLRRAQALHRVHGRRTGLAAHPRAYRSPARPRFELGVESNGTLPLPEGLDWITVSPKGSNPLATTSGHELKLVWPQQGCSPEDFEDLDFRHFLLQPCDDPRNKANTRECIAYCLLHPRWSLGLQTHKWVGVR